MYFSVSKTVFPCHTEDVNLASVNFCHDGMTIWLTIASDDYHCFVVFVRNHNKILFFVL